MNMRMSRRAFFGALAMSAVAAGVRLPMGFAAVASSGPRPEDIIGVWLNNDDGWQCGIGLVTEPKWASVDYMLNEALGRADDDVMLVAKEGRMVTVYDGGGKVLTSNRAGVGEL